MVNVRDCWTLQSEARAVTGNQIELRPRDESQVANDLFALSGDCQDISMAGLVDCRAPYEHDDRDHGRRRERPNRPYPSSRNAMSLLAAADPAHDPGGDVAMNWQCPHHQIDIEVGGGSSRMQPAVQSQVTGKLRSRGGICGAEGGDVAPPSRVESAHGGIGEETLTITAHGQPFPRRTR